jgi:hypothetical protein
VPSPILYQGDLGPFDSPSRPPGSLRYFRDMANLSGLPIQGLDRLVQVGWELTYDSAATNSHTPYTSWQKLWRGRNITLKMSQMFPDGFHSLNNIKNCTEVVYHECTHAYLLEFETDISNSGLKSSCETYYGNGSLPAGKTDDPWRIAHESGAGYVGEIVAAFSDMFFANNALRNGLNLQPPGTPDQSLAQTKSLVLTYIKIFREILARNTFGYVDQMRITKPILPALRTFLGSAMLSQLERTGLTYAAMFSSEIIKLQPNAASQ